MSAMQDRAPEKAFAGPRVVVKVKNDENSNLTLAFVRLPYGTDIQIPTQVSGRLEYNLNGPPMLYLEIIKPIVEVLQ